jgi:pimeloyl-ACP methyl ester carboxylesterase
MHAEARSLRAFLGALTLLASCAGAPAPVRSDSAPPAPERSGYARAGSDAVYYRDTGGSGPVLVLLHAFSGNSALWENQLLAFSAAGYRCIAFDRAGHGRSPKSANPRYTASEELAALLRALRLERVHLLGTAAGGGVALRFALSYPERVLSVVVANSLMGPMSDPSYRAVLGRLLPPTFSALPLELRELGPSYRVASPDGVQRWLALSARSEPPAATELPPLPAAPPAAEPPARPEVELSFAALRGVRVPALLLTGDADLYSPPALLELFRPHLPGAQFAVVRDSGHAAHWENPAVFNRLVLDFLAQARERTPTPS